MQNKSKKQKLLETNNINIENNSSNSTQMTDQLMAKINENNSYFSSLIDLIPPKIYFEGNQEIMESIENNKRLRFGDENELSLKAKHKRFKLDPNSNQKVSQIAQQFYSNGKQLNNNNNNKGNKLDELKQKLNQRIIQLKSTRGSKQNAKKLRESKKERRKQNSIRSSKQKGFIKNSKLNNDLDEESLKKKSKKSKVNNSESNGNNNSDKNEKLPKIYNKDGNLVYSKFDFVSPMVENDPNQKKKNKKSLNKLLVKAKREEQKLANLEETDVMAAKKVKDNKLWRNALQKSEGNKVRDNSKLIEKTLKKKKKLKMKSVKEWKDRNETLENKMKSKQDKRKRNLDERRKQVKDRKISKARKKGRIIPK